MPIRAPGYPGILWSAVPCTAGPTILGGCPHLSQSLPRHTACVVLAHVTSSDVRDNETAGDQIVDDQIMIGDKRKKSRDQRHTEDQTLAWIHSHRQTRNLQIRNLQIRR